MTVIMKLFMAYKIIKKEVEEDGNEKWKSIKIDNIN
jgi:hypothetical protein